MTSQSMGGGMDLKNWAIVVWGLYIASFFTFAITTIIGVIIAYVKRGDAVGTPYESHMTYAIRTFWISLIVGLIGLVLAVIGIGFVILTLLFVWQLYRVIRGLSSRSMAGPSTIRPGGYKPVETFSAGDPLLTTPTPRAGSWATRG
jgi:uncharacterized membrane protein